MADQALPSTDRGRSEQAPSPTGEDTSSLWRHRGFLKLWAGQTISQFGSQFSLLALPLVAAVGLQASPAEMGILAAAEAAPFLLLGLFAGVWVDRNRRRPFLILGDLGRALVLATIPLAALAGALSIYQLYAVGFAVGVLTVFFDVAYQAYLPSLVGRAHLVEGNGKLEVSRSTAQVAGPSVAGLVIQAVGAPLAIVLDSLSFLGSAVCLLLIRGDEERPAAPRSPMLAQLREGLAVVFGNPLLRPIAGCTATSNFSIAAFGALVVLFATRELGLGAASLGLVFSLGSVGALVGALLAGRAATRFGVGRSIVWSAFALGVGLLPIAFATPALAVPALSLGWFVVNLGGPIYNINQVSLRQAVTPFALQGRMTATMRFLVWGMMPAGSLAGGALAQAIGLREAMVAAAVGGLLAFPWVLLSPVVALRRIPEAAAE